MALSLLRSISHRVYNSADDFFAKRTRFGEINEFFKYQIISSDSKRYTLPFLTNLFRSKIEKESWPEREDLEYDYEEGHPVREEAICNFNVAYAMLKDRISKNSAILDIGCSTGFFLEQWHKNGFSNLYGLDPQNAAIESGKKIRPYINFRQGFFGPKKYDIQCDLLTFFQTIFRVPYEDRLFDAIDRCTANYVLVAWVEDATNLFVRDIHAGMARNGFMCIEKRVLNLEFQPFCTSEKDSALLEKNENGDYIPLYTCYYLFRRIELRN